MYGGTSDLRCYQTIESITKLSACGSHLILVFTDCQGMYRMHPNLLVWSLSSTDHRYGRNIKGTKSWVITSQKCQITTPTSTRTWKLKFCLERMSRGRRYHYCNIVTSNIKTSENSKLNKLKAEKIIWNWGFYNCPQSFEFHF